MLTQFGNSQYSSLPHIAEAVLDGAFGSFLRSGYHVNVMSHLLYDLDFQREGIRVDLLL